MVYSAGTYDERVGGKRKRVETEWEEHKLGDSHATEEGAARGGHKRKQRRKGATANLPES